MEAAITYIAFWFLILASIWFFLFRDMGTEPEIMEEPAQDEDEEKQEIWRYR
jgi:hypothetical protein